jgi:outer membrane protein assembly factor BamA
MMRFSIQAVFVCLVSVIPMAGQFSSRTEEIEAARRDKAANLKPDETSKTEQLLVTIHDKKIIERITDGIAGFRVKLGGLATGSGFAVGPEYLRRDLAKGNMIFRASTRASAKRYYIMDVQLTMPKLANDHVFVDLYGVHRNLPRIDYYGPGPDSAKTGRTNFRLEDTAYDVTAGVKPIRHLSLGASGGYMQVNVGPGQDDRFASTDRVFTPQTTPGLEQQTDFLRGSVFAQYDWRDNPGGPRRGGNYEARYWYYGDRDFSRYTFRRLDLDVQQYFPFFNDRRVIALRGKSVLSYPNVGQVVPFYMQPTLGGSEMLRGFRPWRFYDDNLIAFSGEYRWEVFSGLDMALFADAGKVFSRHAQWNLKDMEGSYGVGMRFNVRNDVFMRIDAGFSHEGFQLWLKFNNVF